MPHIKENPSLFFESDIIHGDVVSILKNIKDYQFDVVIADPPYNIGKNFGNNFDNMDIKQYIEWSQKWVNLCFNLLSKNGIIYIYGFTEVLARIAAVYPIDKQRFLIWHYTNKTTPSSKFWQRSHESILCLWKDDKPKLEIDQIREPYSESYLKCVGKKRKATEGRFGAKETTYKVNINGALPRDVIKIPALAGGAGASERHFICKTCDNQFYLSNELKNHKNHDILKHPTQKPLELAKKLIKSRINGENGRTLVPFSGSGSECVAAKLLNVEYLGIEINKDFVNYAKQWINNV